MVLLDTHAFVWLVSDQTQLESEGLALISKNMNSIYISSITALEISLLVKKERLILPVAPDIFLESALEHHNIEEIPIEKNILFKSSNLPDIHNDPFDRIIIATAQIKNMKLITKDLNIKKYPDLITVW
jgi:PIN domain nuclease of toxin-antitoxin system